MIIMDGITAGGPNTGMHTQQETDGTDEIDDDDITPDTNSMNMIHTNGAGFDENIHVGHSENYNNNYNNHVNAQEGDNNNGYEDVDNIGNMEDDDDMIIDDIANHVTAGGPMDVNDNNNNNDQYEDLDDIQNIDDDIMVVNDIDHHVTAGYIGNNNNVSSIVENSESDELIMNDIAHNVTSGGPIDDSMDINNNNLDDDEIIIGSIDEGNTIFLE